MGDRLETGLTACFNTMINYHLSQKLKLLGNGEYNHLTFTLQNLIEKNKLHQKQSTTHTKFSKKKKKKDLSYIMQNSTPLKVQLFHSLQIVHMTQTRVATRRLDIKWQLEPA